MKIFLCLAVLTGQFQLHPELGRGGRAGPALQAWLFDFQTGLLAQGRASAGAHIRGLRSRTEDALQMWDDAGSTGSR